MTNENGNVVVAGYMVGMNYRDRIGSYRLGIEFSKGGTKNDYIFGNACAYTVTMLKDTLGADGMYKHREELKGKLIAIAFELNRNNEWTAVKIGTLKKNLPKKCKRATTEYARFIMDLNNSETEKNIMNWCQVKAEGHQDQFEHEERVISSECIENGYVNRKYGIKTAVVANGNNFNYYLHN